MNRPSLAIAGLTACSGCQLTLLNCEEELPDILQRFDIAFFPMGGSALPDAEFSAALVEGTVSTPPDLALLRDLRERSRLLVAFGTCARWGGVAAMCNGLARERLARRVYGRGHLPDTFEPAPLERFVSVDFALVGCPPEKWELLLLLGALLRGTLPLLPEYPVCTECRMAENSCLLLERDELCLGPISRAGCGARCPAVSVVCEGCRGPVAEANVAEELTLLTERGHPRSEIVSRMRRFCPEWDYGQRH